MRWQETKPDTARHSRAFWSATFAKPAETEAKKSANVDPKALFNIGYGLYVVTVNDGNKDNGCIVNTVAQVANNPLCVSVSISKANYTGEVVKATGKLNVNCLNTETPFSVFKHFGFQSGRDVDKFAENEKSAPRTSNGLVRLPDYINSYISLKVIESVDLGSHNMFLCEVTECETVNSKETMTYNYYQQNVKPKPETKKKGYVCEVCGYIYEGDELPDDIICPTCKHDASAFKKL